MMLRRESNSGFSRHPRPALLQLLDGEARRERLLQLLRLLAILDHQRVKITAASHLELGVALVLLDLNRLGVLSSGRQKKVLDLLNLLRHLEILFVFLMSYFKHALVLLDLNRLG